MFDYQNQIINFGQRTPHIWYARSWGWCVGNRTKAFWTSAPTIREAWEKFEGCGPYIRGMIVEPYRAKAA